ncbi:Lrp/AsnC family transcriptional regulator [Arenibacterium halophilum]|uniref:Lrp/AsnC family transcriptional regulator n=1 Tax=Arenibacterium halophilum TaxID=2583821 RepID=A0ABY2X098_9RHOB|nr:Lrp/AsnC family transcriptional regulator [Arenibacterium halophilum]TMV08270.1 Lrp/AsnC family transcriptional regulator [Arenibacterium halophilum]
MPKPDADLDHIDRKILLALSEEGRLSNAALGDRVGLSASPCWQRVRRLEEQGYIQGYAAILDQERLGASEIVMIEVILERHDDDVLEGFGRTMQRMPEVLEVHLTTGEYDYLIKVAVQGTKGYEAFLRDKLYRVKGLRHTRSSFVLRTLKDVQAFIPDR